MSLIRELKRRNVFRVAIAYLAAAWLLTEVSGTLFPLFDVPEWTVRFIVIVLAVGFFPVLVFSWAYELTSEGLRREKDVIRERSVTRQTAKRLDLMTMGLIIVALLVIAVDQFWLNSQPEPQTATVTDLATDPISTVEVELASLPDSIAVLPFANRSANTDDIFFVDGIHDDLLTYVAQIGSLKVISRTSVMEYRDTLKKIPEIAQELGVTHVLEGGVQRAGDQVRINVQLIDARTDDHVWSKIYDRELTAVNVFAIQSEVAGAVAEALRATLTPEAQDRLQAVPTRELAALEAYFMGRRQLAKRNVPAMAEAIGYFSAAVERDPDFALAYVGLADATRLRAAYASVTEDERLNARSEARLFIDRALKLDPLLGEAYATIGTLLIGTSSEAAEESFQRAIQLNPNYAPAYQWYGEMLGGMDGRISEALELSEKAVSLDPMSAIINNDYGEVLQQAGRYEDALVQYEKSVAIEPEFAPGYSRIMGLQAIIYGRLDEAIRYQRKVLDIDPKSWRSADVMAYWYLELNDMVNAAVWHDHALELVPEGIVPDSQIELALFLGEFDKETDAATSRLARRPRDFTSIIYLVEQALAHNRQADVRQLLEEHFPELSSGGEPIVNDENIWAAVSYAGLLRSSGETEKATQLLDLSLDIIENASPHELAHNLQFVAQEARIRMLLGEREIALEALPRVGDYGWWRYWQYRLKQDRVLEPLHDDPAYQEVIKEIETELAKQRARLHEWEAEGVLNSLPGD